MRDSRFLVLMLLVVTVVNLSTFWGAECPSESEVSTRAERTVSLLASQTRLEPATTLPQRRLDRLSIKTSMTGTKDVAGRNAVAQYCQTEVPIVAPGLWPKILVQTVYLQNSDYV